jgi:hypothetical protein
MIDDAPLLDYAPARQGRNWRRRIVRGTIALLIIAIACGAYLYRQEISLRVRRVYWARQCMKHVTPPGTVLYELDPVKAKVLVSSNQDYILSSGNPPTAIYSPRAWRKYAESLRVVEGASEYAIVFLGERRSLSGHRRLVMIRSPLTRARNLVLNCEVIIPPSVLDTRHQRTGWGGSFGGLPVDIGPAVADAADPTHLTIDFVGAAAGAKLTPIEVYLRDDDNIDLRLPNPP